MSVEREMSLAEWCAKLPSQHVVNRELATLIKQLAALAEQNEKMRSFLEFAWKDIPMNEYAFKILEHTMNLPNLATPVLNRIKGNK